MQKIWETARNLRADALGHTEELRKEFIELFLVSVEMVALARAAKGHSAGFVYIKDGDLDIMRECFVALQAKVAPFHISMTEDGRYVRVSWS